jgi:hypothetical protein
MVFPVLMGIFFLAFIGVFITVFVIILKNAFAKPAPSSYGGSAFHGNTIPLPLTSREEVCLPRIREDFPTFDPSLSYANAHDALRRQLGNRPDFAVHSIVIADYVCDTYEKIVILQAALQYREAGCLLQKRYVLHYAYRLGDGQPLTAANCPNCGAPLSDPEAAVCEYCDSPFLNPMDGSWRFTQILEDFPPRP